MPSGYKRQVNCLSGYNQMFPILYHAHHSLYTEDLSFWMELATNCKGPILELGCGTGRVLLSIAQSCRFFYGLDNNLDMLSILKDNISPDLQPWVHVLQADMTGFNLGIDFGLILLPCNTYSILSLSERKSTLSRVYDHLSNGGILAVSLPNPSLLEHLGDREEYELEEVFPHPINGEPVQVSSAWTRTGQHFIVTWNYDHLSADGSIQRLSTQFKHNLNPVQTTLDEIRNAGFERLGVYGDFDRSTYASDSAYLIILASKI
jgi:SAM-dependent methyltransferase